MKIGDKVRFLNEVGGGRVAGFQGKNVVLVEDNDGFQVPLMTSEVVVIEEDKSYDRSANRAQSSQPSTSSQNAQTTQDPQSAQPSQQQKEPPLKRVPQERPDGNRLSAYLAFVPMEIKELTQTRFEAYLVNDCNYYLRYVILTAEGASWKFRDTGVAEPNTSVFIEEFGREQLNELEHISVQLLAYKRNKPFALKPSTDVRLRIDGVKFYKLHTFQENDFFETPALIYPIIENDHKAGIQHYE